MTVASTNIRSFYLDNSGTKVCQLPRGEGRSHPMLKRYNHNSIKRAHTSPSLCVTKVGRFERSNGWGNACRPMTRPVPTLLDAARVPAASIGGMEPDGQRA
jgi:hypothetical protein